MNNSLEYSRKWRASNRERSNAYTKKWRAANRKRHNASTARWRQENLDRYREICRKSYLKTRVAKTAREHSRYKKRVDRIRKLKEWCSCLDCGKNFPHYMMEFDHREPNSAVRCSTGRRMDLTAISNEKKLREELQKCDIICANCHCRRTWERNHGGWRYRAR